MEIRFVEIPRKNRGSGDPVRAWLEWKSDSWKFVKIRD